SELANKCLQSSTIDNELAASYIKELKKYMEFETTLAYLKAPPANYHYPPVDILDGLDKLAYKAATGGFQSQYTLDLALAALLTSAHEGHLAARYCTSVTILYERPVQFISVSTDGIKLPEIYVLSDFVSATKDASKVVSINEQDASEFIEQEALWQASDPDSSYNSMFWSSGRTPGSGYILHSMYLIILTALSSPIGSFTNPGVNFYPGPWTNITFGNGTTVPIKNHAMIPGTWSAHIIDGESFTDYFCIAAAQPVPTETTTSISSATPTSNGTSSPQPTENDAPEVPSVFPYAAVVRDPSNQVAGYFINGTAYKQTGVLWVGAFSPSGRIDPLVAALSFQETVAKFFDAMLAANKTKLIIDMSGNRGGNTLLPTDLFKRLFPHIEAYGASRIRVPVAGDIFGQTLAAIPDELIDPTQEEIETLEFGDKGKLFTSVFQYRSHMTTDLKNFTRWSDLYPPNVQNGDNFTLNYRGPLNNTFYTRSISGINVYGYEHNPATFPQPFLTENIVILTDGICASSCSIFTELMTRNANVKIIVVGGRPRNGPMQAIGGTKGTLATPYTSIAFTADLVLNYTDYIPSHLIETANATFPGLVPLPLGFPSDLGSYSVNGQDNIAREEDGEGHVPLQFVFEPADCRIFYNGETVLEENKLWEYVWDVAWGKGR
ncbi:hypothetical protein DL98DRAFT_357750, partial [Cadophora sp. DSE1049]